MRLLADENVKGRLIRWLKASGHAVAEAPKGVRNSRLVALARSEHRILLTNDTDFLNTALYPLEDSPGRLILRVFPPTLVNQRMSLSMALSKLTDTEIAGKLLELRRDGFEIRAE